MSDMQKLHGEDNEDAVFVPAGDSSFPKVTTTEKVRGGHTGDGLSRILGVSFAGAAVALVIAYFLFFR